jgi:hypothetical protein
VIIITTQLLNVFWALAEGIAKAGASRIGSALGDGNLENVQLFMKLTMINILLECIPLATTCFIMRKRLVEIFNVKDDVVLYFESTFWLACIDMVTYHVQTGLNQGLLVAFGEQRFIAWVSCIACHGIALPIVIFTVFYTDMKVIGVMTGQLTADLISVVAALFKISRIDLRKEVEKTAVRVATAETESDVQKGQENPAYQVENEELHMNAIGDREADKICTYGCIDKKETLGSNKLNQEMKNVLLAFLISTIVCMILVGISLLRQ